MSHIVLAVGATVVSLSGSTWYLPAVADLRAGDDRPRSRHLAAWACVTGWTTVAAVGLLLFVPAPWQALCAVAVTGAAAGVLLRRRARALLAGERRETDACWTALGRIPPTADTEVSRRVLLAWTLLGTAAASVLAITLLLLTDPVTAALASVSVAGATLLAALAAAARAGGFRRPRCPAPMPCRSPR